MSLNRIILSTKDIERITGRSERQSRAILAGVRKSLGKQPRQHVSIQEYCRHTGLPEEDVARHLGIQK
ncbi:hypothetical protein KK062_26180 [Fulvivirgaceae bacterium PWU5]|jgi:hypothetical protein|uniref:Uncharacterized protein n=1 Tax=Dawidia cretensis TaxID=2782350 RepID=A0AAP2E4W7_9BACT|nr:hypothetical protein [Dawidia cretensis]MBT1711757.1 hypothetical protein [Dawidia cretensis]